MATVIALSDRISSDGEVLLSEEIQRRRKLFEK